MSAGTSRREVVALAALSAIGGAVSPAAGHAGAARCGILDLCRDYHRAVAACPGIDRALRAALAEAGRLQALLHNTEDLAGELLDALEVTPVSTLEEAEAKVRVGRTLVQEGLDPKRHEFLSAALAAAERLA